MHAPGPGSRVAGNARLPSWSGGRSPGLAHIEQRREQLGLSKADLARLVGMRPEAVRRLLSAGGPNPTLFTVTKLASALGMQIEIKPSVPAGKLGPKVRKVAKQLATAAN